MLSYQHIFHAGNHADVIKHLVLCGCLDYMKRKAVPMLYLDTHAGSGVYALDDARARKTGEADSGVLALDFPALISAAGADASALAGIWYATLSHFLGASQYPGSPVIASHLLRDDDSLALFELHPAEFENLQQACGDDPRIHLYREDGFRGLRLLPPRHKRALVLVDPSYERDDDYRKVTEFCLTAWKRMKGACLLLWYPVIERRLVDSMARRLQQGGVRDLWQCELGITADRRGAGMTASGLFLVNPPWQLPGQLATLLPLIAGQLAPGNGHHSVNCLVME